MIYANLTEIYPRVYLINLDTQYQIASLFLRMQEFYESSYPKIRGNFFTLEDYMDTYAADHGNFTYTMDWNGFNVPGNVVQQFLATLDRHLSQKETELKIALLSKMRINCDPSQLNVYSMPTDFYLIGTWGNGHKNDVMRHEIAHAFYYLNSDYQIAMNSMAMNMPKDIYNKLAKKMMDMGYAENVIMDEIQAYLSTSSFWYLIKKFGPLSIPFKSVFESRRKYKEFVK